MCGSRETRLTIDTTQETMECDTADAGEVETNAVMSIEVRFSAAVSILEGNTTAFT